MKTSSTILLDSGYSKTGIFWEIHRYNLRYTSLFAVRVNGRETQFRTKDECYKHLSDTKVTSFKKVISDGKASYEEMEADNNVTSGDGNKSSGGSIQFDDANDRGEL